MLFILIYYINNTNIINTQLEDVHLLYTVGFSDYINNIFVVKYSKTIKRVRKSTRGINIHKCLHRFILLYNLIIQL